MIVVFDFHCEGENGVRLKLVWVKHWWPLISRGGGCLVHCVVWTMVTFYLC